MVMGISLRGPRKVSGITIQLNLRFRIARVYITGRPERESGNTRWEAIMHVDELTRREFLKGSARVSIGAAAALGSATSRVMGAEAAKKPHSPLLPNAADL